MKTNTTTPESPEEPVGPLQARILKVLAYKESTAAEITETLNADPGVAAGTIKSTTIASVRDTLYRRLVAKGLVDKLPVAFALAKKKGKKK